MEAGVEQVEVAEPATEAPKRRLAPRIGWHVRSLRDGRFQARAYDPRERKKRAKTFKDEGDARRWARSTHSQLATGQAQAGTAPATALLADYMKVKERRCRSIAHTKEVRRIIQQAIAFGMTDLRSDRATGLATEFIARLRAKRAADDGERPRLAPRTENRVLNTLSAFARWGIRNGHLLRNPFAPIERTIVPDQLKPTWSVDELRALTDPKRKAHPAFLWVLSMCYLGLRQNEAANLDLGWFRWNDRMVFVRGKRARERWVPIPREYERLVRPIARARQLRGELAGPLIADFAHLSRKSRQRRYNAYVEACKVTLADSAGRDRTPHSCRATWACLKLATGEQQTMVKLMGGWDDDEMMGLYASSAVGYLRAVEGWAPGEIEIHRTVVKRRPTLRVASGRNR